MLIKGLYRVPPFMLTIVPKMVIISSTHNLSSFNHVFFNETIDVA